MLELLITFLLVFLGLATFLWAGTLFFQGYIYSEPVSALYWRAPASGAAIALLLAFWCFLDYRNPGRYNATWFEPTPSDEEVFNKFWSVKGNREVLYQAHKDALGRVEYRDAAGRPWTRSDADGVVEAIIVEGDDGQRIRFNAELTKDKKFKAETGEPVRYVEAGGRGRVMTDRYIGKLPISHWGTSLAKILLTLLHFGLWFLCLWLLLQFQWGHAFGLALVLWLALTMTLVPLIFAKTEATAKQRSLTSTPISRLGGLRSSRSCRKARRCRTPTPPRSPRQGEMSMQQRDLQAHARKFGDNLVEEILRLFGERGDAAYIGEPVSQTEHALQAAWAAEKAGVGNALIAAALLHDVGHLLHELPEDCAQDGIDDAHEVRAVRFLQGAFGPEVTEPIRLHVAAKRFLCATEPGYFERLSEASVLSLRLQGGPFTPEQVRDFRQNPHAQAAVALRRWDEEAKIPDLKTPDLDHYRPCLKAVYQRTAPLPNR